MMIQLLLRQELLIPIIDAVSKDDSNGVHGLFWSSSFDLLLWNSSEFQQHLREFKRFQTKEAKSTSGEF